MANSRLRVVLHAHSTIGVGGEQNNVWYYESQGGTVNALAFAEAFETDILQDLGRVQHLGIKYDMISVVDLDDPTNFADYVPTVNVAGQQVGADFLPNFVAWSFQYIRASYASRHGWKRFSGLTEDMLSGGAASSVTLADLLTLANALEDTVYVLPIHCLPKIGRRPPPGGNLSDTVLFPVQAVAYREITTQNTRKR